MRVSRTVQVVPSELDSKVKSSGVSFATSACMSYRPTTAGADNLTPIQPTQPAVQFEQKSWPVLSNALAKP